MHFRFKTDINTNFTMQNIDWLFIGAFFLLSTHLVPKDLPLFICYLIAPRIFSIIRKNKTAFWSSLVPNSTLYRGSFCGKETFREESHAWWPSNLGSYGNHCWLVFCKNSFSKKLTRSISILRLHLAIFLKDKHKYFATVSTNFF